MDSINKTLDYEEAEAIYRNIKLTESYWPGNTGHELLDSTVPWWLYKNAQEVPDKEALVEGVMDPEKRRRWTYKQLLEDAEKMATALLNVFHPGEHIAIMASNLVEYSILQYGIAIAGMTMVTLNPSYHKREVEHILKKADIAGVFVQPEWRGNRMLDTINLLAGGMPHLREIIRIDELDEFIAQNSAPVEFPEVKPEDSCVIMFTSGTTGVPKGARLNHFGMTNATRLMALRAGMPHLGVWVNVMPMQHMGGNGFAALGTLQQQGTLVQAQEFDPKLFLTLVEQEKGYYSLLVPTMIEAILNYPDRDKYDISTLKTIQSGASKVEVWLVERVRKELGCAMSIVCGQTESHGGYTQTHLDDDPEDQAETIGQPYPVIELKISDPVTHAVMPLNEEGEICVRGYQVMVDYYNDPEFTKEAIDEEGWLHSGDLATMDDRGFVKFRGRLKDMIIRGGVNLYPAEIERLLMEHPKVLKVAVVGIDDDYWGEKVACCIVPKSKEDPPKVEELDAMCLDNLARFKRPRVYAFMDDFPVTSTGKLRKFKLKEWLNRGELETVEV